MAPQWHQIKVPCGTVRDQSAGTTRDEGVGAADCSNALAPRHDDRADARPTIVRAIDCAALAGRCADGGSSKPSFRRVSTASGSIAWRRSTEPLHDEEVAT